MEEFLLPFGGHKGSAIAMMVELLAAGLVGDMFSFEAKMQLIIKMVVLQGGVSFIMALSPQLIAGKGWNEHAEKFFEQMESMDGVRLPGQRRHNNRKDIGPRNVKHYYFLNKIKSLLE